jgi:Putative transposase
VRAERARWFGGKAVIVLVSHSTALACHAKPVCTPRRSRSPPRPRSSAGPEAVLAYLARYTHRVAISNSRLISLDERGVTFRYKDYRRNGRARHRMMTLAPDEFIRRFLLHVLPKGFHRIRHYYKFSAVFWPRGKTHQLTG